MVYVYQLLQPLVLRVIYKSATSMILSTTLGDRFMLPCSLLIYETKLGKQTIASLSTDKERSKLLRNWAHGEYSLEKSDRESSSEDADDSGTEDEFREISLSGSEDDDEEERSPPKAPKGKTKQSNKKSDIRLGLQRSAVRWTAVTDEAGFQAQAGSDYEEYVEPRAPKAGHVGASISSMLSPIKEIGERPEPSSAEKRGTRSAGKQPLSATEGHTPSKTERHEMGTAERRGTRSAEKRVPSI
eukprot:2930397-Pleurochrysis_carterae.AAC.1